MNRDIRKLWREDQGDPQNWVEKEEGKENYKVAQLLTFTHSFAQGVVALASAAAFVALTGNQIAVIKPPPEEERRGETV